MFLLHCLGSTDLGLAASYLQSGVDDLAVDKAGSIEELFRTLPVFLDLEKLIEGSFSLDRPFEKNRGKCPLRNTDGLTEKCAQIRAGLDAEMLANESCDLVLSICEAIRFVGKHGPEDRVKNVVGRFGVTKYAVAASVQPAFEHNADRSFFGAAADKFFFLIFESVEECPRDRFDDR